MFAPASHLSLLDSQEHACIKHVLHSPDVAALLSLAEGQGASLQREGLSCSALPCRAAARGQDQADAGIGTDCAVTACAAVMRRTVVVVDIMRSYIQPCGCCIAHHPEKLSALSSIP